MRSSATVSKAPGGLTDVEQFAALSAALGDGPIHRALIVPPDYTRLHSGAGKITRFVYHFLRDAGAEVDVMPALGTHAPVTRDECERMFGDLPFDEMLVHRWRDDVVKLGEVPAAFVREVSEGLVDQPISVEVNRRLIEGNYDLILSIGQVVPHEVAGMANRNKNLFVGLGGADMINSSHMLGAFYGLERIMGRDHTPVRKVFDYAEERFLAHLPIEYALTVTTAPGGEVNVHGLFMGRQRDLFERAVSLSREKNLTFVDRPLQTVVAYLDEEEFKSSWLGNKAIYRTRMAIADGGELIVLAPGVRRFGEDPTIDGLIRKYGFRGREATLAAVKANDDLKANLSAAAHLIHSSSDGRFRVTYCTRYLSSDEVRSVGFGYAPYDEMIQKYNPATLREGNNPLPGGEEVYFIPNPALGLWADRARFD